MGINVENNSKDENLFMKIKNRNFVCYKILGLDWIILYFITMPVDALLIKRALNRIELPPWSLALYNNLIAAMFMPLGAVLARQWEVFTPAAYTDLVASDVWFPVLVEEKCPHQKLSSKKHFWL